MIGLPFFYDHLTVFASNTFVRHCVFRYVYSYNPAVFVLLNELTPIIILLLLLLGFAIRLTKQPSAYMVRVQWIPNRFFKMCISQVWHSIRWHLWWQIISSKSWLISLSPAVVIGPVFNFKILSLNFRFDRPPPPPSLTFLLTIPVNNDGVGSASQRDYAPLRSKGFTLWSRLISLPPKSTFIPTFEPPRSL